LEFDWNLGAKYWNSSFLEFVPTFWNRVGILESTSGLADALFKLPSMRTPTRTRSRARKQRTGLKIFGTKKYRQTFRLGGMGEIVIT